MHKGCRGGETNFLADIGGFDPPDPNEGASLFVLTGASARTGRRAIRDGCSSDGGSLERLEHTGVT